MKILAQYIVYEDIWGEGILYWCGGKKYYIQRFRGQAPACGWDEELKAISEVMYTTREASLSTITEEEALKLIAFESKENKP